MACTKSEPAPTHASPPPPPATADAADAADAGEMPFAISGAGFIEVASGAGMRRYSSPPGSPCMAEVRWWRPYPTETGGPMQVASKRRVTFAGAPRDLVTTSMFEGEARKVDAAFLSGEGWHARVVFTDCGEAEEDQVLATIVVPGDR